MRRTVVGWANHKLMTGYEDFNSPHSFPSAGLVSQLGGGQKGTMGLV